MMQKKLLSGLFWVLLANLIVKPFWILGVEVGVQNAVGAAEYGIYIDIFNLAYIFNILLDIGISNFNTRNIAQHPQLISKHLPNILGMKLLLLGLYLIVTFTVGLLSGYESREFLLLCFLSLNQFLNSLILYLRSNFEGLLLFKWDSLLSVLDRVMMIVICGALLWTPNHPDFTIEYFVYAQTIAYVVSVLVALLLLARKVGLRGLRFRPAFSLAIVKQSLPFALLVLLMASYNRIDPLLLKRLSPEGLGNLQAGIYAGAFRLLDALTMIAYLISVPLLPIFARLTKSWRSSDDASRQDAQSEIEVTSRQMFSLVFVFSLTAAVTLSGMGKELMDLLYDDYVADYSSVFRILIYGIIPICVTYVFGTLLTANGSLKQLNILASITLVVNVLVNLLLIPSLGAVGSAWASLTAQSFMALTQLWLALRIFNIRVGATYILKLVIFTLIILGSILLPPIDWWLRLLLMMAVGLAAALSLRLVDLKELIAIVKEKETNN